MRAEALCNSIAWTRNADLIVKTIMFKAKLDIVIGHVMMIDGKERKPRSERQRLKYCLFPVAVCVWLLFLLA